MDPRRSTRLAQKSGKRKQPDADDATDGNSPGFVPRGVYDQAQQSESQEPRSAPKRACLVGADADAMDISDVSSAGLGASSIESVSSQTRRVSDMGAFNAVPKELMEIIFELLDFRARVSAQRVCRTWKIYAWCFVKQVDLRDWCPPTPVSFLRKVFTSYVSHTRLQTLSLGLTDRIEEYLGATGPLTRMSSLHIIGNVSMTDAAMASIGQMTSLVNLELSRCNEKLAEAMGHLSSLTRLTSLDLSMNIKVSNASFEVVSRLTNLKSLDISRLRRLTSAGLAQLPQLTNLQKLNMTSCSSMDDQSMSIIASLARLTYLRVSRCAKISSGAYMHLTSLTGLRHLEMQSSKLENRHMVIFQHLTKLETLNLKRVVAVMNDGLENLSGLTNLTSLDLTKLPKLTHDGMSFLKYTTKLRKLYLRGNALLKDDSVAFLANLECLEELDVSECTGLEGSSFGFLSPRCMKVLDLSKCVRLTDQAILAISALTELKSLQLASSYMGGGRPLALVNLRQLTYLGLQACEHIRDTDLGYIASLTKLRHLDLSYCTKITDAGVARLTTLTDLQTLDLIKGGAISCACVKLIQNATVVQ